MADGGRHMLEAFDLCQAVARIIAVANCRRPAADCRSRAGAVG